MLTIAGSDPSGGAGIEADLKVFTSLKVYGVDAITSITVQNSQGVFKKLDVPPDFLKKQLEKLFEDFEINVIKIGMVSSFAISKTIADFLTGKTVVYDPVIYSKNGFPLNNESEIIKIIEILLPLTTILTPNYFELKKISGLITDNSLEMAKKVLVDFCNLKALVVKGGHIEEEKERINDSILIREREKIKKYDFSYPRIRTQNLHGTGCTLSSAIAAYLALSFDTKIAVKRALKYTHLKILSSSKYRICKGKGPLIHFL